MEQFSNFHPKQLDLFKKMKADNNLSHAFLFTGPKGVGKLDFARYIAYFLQDIEKQNSHPDIIETSVPLPIKEAKELKKRLVITPYSGKYKIVIINEAENMHTDAANSLLKMIEEPSGDTIFILISAYSQKLLDTMRSRCMEVKFNFVPDEVMSKKLNTEKIKDIAPHWRGRPAIAQKLIEDEVYNKKIRDYIKDYSKFMEGSLAERFNISEKYGKIKDRGELTEILRVWMEEARESGQKEKLLKSLLEIYKNTTNTNANFQYAFNNLSVNI